VRKLLFKTVKDILFKSFLFLSWVVIISGGIFIGLNLSQNSEKSKLIWQRPQLYNQNVVQNKIKLDLQVLEIASTANEQENGLMNRQNLCKNCGMLFVYNEARQLTFWMKNTFVSLDIFFIDENGKIVKLYPSTKTNQTEEVYTSIKNSKYVLEVNSGYSIENNLKEEMYVDIDHLINQTNYKPDISTKYI
jgi:uncharacterized membrane protein (UPF0127 family)